MAKSAAQKEAERKAKEKAEREAREREKAAKEKAAREQETKKREEEKRKTALDKEPPKQPLRGEARKEAQAKAVIAGTKAPTIKPGQKEFSGPTRPENKAIYSQMSPEDQAKYNWLRANGKLEQANKFMAAKTGQTPTGPGGRARTPEDRNFTPAPPAQTPTPTPEATPSPEPQFQDMPFPQQVEEVVGSTGNVVSNMGDIAAGFDPRTMQQQYEMQFNQEMDRYRKNIMDQFERRNQRQFEQQRLATQQQIAERGLDPASPAAQELMRQQNEREDLARQEAMSAAEQGAYGIQQQAFGQAREQALIPGQISQQFQDPFLARMQQDAARELQRLEIEAAAGRLDVQGKQALEQLRLQGRQRMQEIRATPRGGGGGGGQQGPTLYERMQAGQLSTGYGQGEQPNPWAAVGQGLAAGAGGQITSNLNRR